MNYIDGDYFLANVFLELIRRNKLQISIEGLIKLEYNYLELLEGKNILNNSVTNIMNFVKKYEQYLEIIEVEEKAKISIFNEVEFEETLLEEFEQNFEESMKYRKALKMLINEEKKGA